MSSSPAFGSIHSSELASSIASGAGSVVVVVVTIALELLIGSGVAAS
jgi:hypothetical protein